jgi:hypothetical protein
MNGLERVEDPDIASNTPDRRGCALRGRRGAGLQLRVALEPDMRAAERRIVDRLAVNHVIRRNFDPASQAWIGVNAQRSFFGATSDETADQPRRLWICRILMNRADKRIETHGSFLAFGHDLIPLNQRSSSTRLDSRRLGLNSPNWQLADT